MKCISKYINPFELTDDGCKILLDYITNLQQENERLKLNHKQLKDIDKIAISNSKLIKEKEDYKQRIEKAVEYLEKPYRDDFDYSRAELIDILNGRSDE